MALHKHLLGVAGTVALVASCGDAEKAGEAPVEKEASSVAPDTPAPRTGDPAAVTAFDLAAHIEILASDEFEGRAPGTDGGEKTREYIAKEYERIGLEPLGESYFHRVPMVEATLEPEKSNFSINGEPLGYGDDVVYWTKRVEETVAIADSDVVFVGYGVVAPEYQWNDYEGLDVAGKTVVMLVNDPGFATEDPALFNGRAMTYYGRWTYKYEEAARQGAAAALIIHDEEPAAYPWGVVEGGWTGPQLDLEREDAGASRVAVEGWLSTDAAKALFSGAGLDLAALTTAAASADFKPVAMEGAIASAELNTKIRRSEDANVVGVLRGSEAPDEYVLYMAHWDHLGKDPAEDSSDKIYNGAVDNATGVAAILEIAETFANAAERPRRSIMIAAVTAEESGLLGSGYLAEDPPVPLRQIVGGINIDALHPTPGSRDMIVVGYGASELEDLLAEAAAKYGRTLRPDDEPEKGYFYRSDHISFAKKGVPMLYADGGVDLRIGGIEAGQSFRSDYAQNRYHQTGDEYDASWNLDGITETVDILLETGRLMASSDAWPNWREGGEFRALRDAQRAEPTGEGETPAGE